MKDWVSQFKLAKGRPPRILHIGNIANNAYLNAKIQRRAGAEAYVLSYDYYHIMGCPEWEDAFLLGHGDDDFAPQWERKSTDTFNRPDWFVQGPTRLCLRYLNEKLEGNTKVAERILVCLNFGNGSFRNFSFVQRCKAWLYLQWNLGSRACKFAIQLCKNRLFSDEKSKKFLSDILSMRLASDNELKLTINDLDNYSNVVMDWQETLTKFDYIQGYALDGVYPFMVGKDYFAYEHGTIRNIPFKDNLMGRVCQSVYRAARFSFITNADNINAANRLGLERKKFIPHPVNECEVSSEDVANLRGELLSELSANFLIFHPARQHWDETRHPDWEKGNDIFIKGFAKFVHQCAPNAAAVFVDWGQKTSESKELIKELGIMANIKWIKPQSNLNMIRYIQASDILADQFYLGAFGSTTPKGFYYKTPVLTYIDFKLHEWCFPVPPPILNANSEELVFQSLKDSWESPQLLVELTEKAYVWYRNFHSNEVISTTFEKVYSENT